MPTIHKITEYQRLRLEAEQSPTLQNIVTLPYPPKAVTKEEVAESKRLLLAGERLPLKHLEIQCQYWDHVESQKVRS